MGSPQELYQCGSTNAGADKFLWTIAGTKKLLQLIGQGLRATQMLVQYVENLSCISFFSYGRIAIKDLFPRSHNLASFGLVIFRHETIFADHFVPPVHPFLRYDRSLIAYRSSKVWLLVLVVILRVSSEQMRTNSMRMFVCQFTRIGHG